MNATEVVLHKVESNRLTMIAAAYPRLRAGDLADLTLKADPALKLA